MLFDMNMMPLHSDPFSYLMGAQSGMRVW